MGRFVESERVIQLALEAATTPFNVAGNKSIAGHLAAERGEFDIAERLLSEAWELMQRSGGFQLIGPNLAWTTSLYVWTGQLDKARERASEGLSRIAGTEPELIYYAELYWLAVRVQAELGAQGEPDRALEVLAAMDEAIADIPGDGAPPEALAFRELARAELSRLTKEPDPAKWRAAGDRFRALDERYRAAYTDFRAAEALALSEAPTDKIAEPLRAAYQTAVEIAARPFEEHVEALAERAGVTLDTGLHEHERGRAQISEVAALLTGSRRGPRPERLLATVLFTDIVGSTALAAELGDRRWRELLDNHDETVRREVGRSGGVVVQFVGGTLSTFDGPARAIGCAWAMRDAVKPLGIEFRAGVHTGEIELRGKHIGGIAVHIGARVAARAKASEILVSQTVTDLVSGSGIQFEKRGEHELKGVPGRWRLFAVLQAHSRESPTPI
jgi:class 3 adenylate cyclase